MSLPWGGIDRWLTGLGLEEAAVAFAVAGGLAVPKKPGFVWWRFDERWLKEPAARALDAPGAETLFNSAAQDGAQLLRVAARGQADFSRVSKRLLAVPAVSSVVLAGSRRADWPRRRAWKWPLRVGLVGVSQDADDITEMVKHFDLGLNSGQVRIVDALAQPSFCDVLVVVGELAEAVRVCSARKLRANAVVVMLDGPEEGAVIDPPASTAPAVGQAHDLTRLRGATGAMSAALAFGALDDLAATDQAVASLVGRVLRYAEDGVPWDVGLTLAADRQVIITGELSPLVASDVRSIIHDWATSVMADVKGLGDLAARYDQLILYAPYRGLDGSFGMAGPLGGGGAEILAPTIDAVEVGLGATEVLAPTIDALEEQLDAASSARVLLCEVNRAPDKDQPESNVIVTGPNVVEVSIGLPRQDAVTAPGADFDAPFHDNDKRSVRVTISFVPQQPDAKAMTKNIMLPRVGDTRRAKFQWDIPAEATSAEARITVIHRNRLLQTALLRGEVGQQADLVDLTLVRPDLNGLDDRRAFDVSLLVEGDQGAESLQAHVRGTTNVVRNEVGDLTDVQAIADRMRDLLDEESFAAGRRGKPNPEAMRKLLVPLAQQGRHLHLRLLGLIDGLADCEYLQLVTATPGWFVPLEFIYPHETPEDEAAICPDWLPGGEGKCGGECIDGDDTTVMCPGAFWGMSRVIERHYRSPRLAGGVSSKEKVDVLTSGEPTAARRRLELDYPVVAASERVSEEDTQSVAEELGDDALICANWREWVEALKAQPRHLLALLPHTDHGQLEINGDFEDAATFASKRYLTGGHDVEPVVLLLGCHTSGSTEEPAGYASDALIHGASIVVTSLSLLYKKHAPEFARRLADELGSAGRKARPVATVMRQFRREAVFAGLPTALGIIAYGDSDWSV